MDQRNKEFAESHREAAVSVAARCSRRELAQIELLKGAHQETVMRVLRDCPVRTLASGEVLLRAGESCAALHMVLSGALRLHDPSSAVPDALVGAGDSIGELLLLQRAVFALTVFAAEPTRVLVVDKETAWALVGVSHEFARNWLGLLAARSRVSGVVGGAEEIKTAHGRHATLDESTGLHNRRWLESMLPRQMGRSATDKAPLALLLIEIDGLADYVARLGPAAGDHVCYAVARALVDGVRPTDLVARYGPAQFVVVLPDSDAINACRVGERVRQTVAKAAPPTPEPGAARALTISVGVAQFQPSTGAPEFLAAAEAALQTARASGGNRVGMQPMGA